MATRHHTLCSPSRSKGLETYHPMCPRGSCPPAHAWLWGWADLATRPAGNSGSCRARWRNMMKTESWLYSPCSAVRLHSSAESLRSRAMSRWRSSTYFRRDSSRSIQRRRSSGSLWPGSYGVIAGAGAARICSSRSKKSPWTCARWHACSCADHFLAAGRCLSAAGGTSRTRGTTMPGARARASTTVAVSMETPLA